MPRLIPFEIPGAAAFSDYSDLANPVHAVGLLKSHPNVLKVLERIEEPVTNRCRPRIPGSYALLYVAFIASGEVDIQPWYQRAVSMDIWTVCGFRASGVSYATVQRHFIELEAHEQAFEHAVSLVVRFVRQRIPEIGQWLHIDSTEAQTHAQLQHACPAGTCPGRRGPHWLSSDDAGRKRRSEADLPEEEALRTPTIQRTITTRTSPKRKIERDVAQYLLNGHLYTTSDLDAGLRAYITKGRTSSMWFGQYNCQVVDHVTGIPVSTRLYPASTNEANFYPDAIEHAMCVTELTPTAVAGDKGFSVSSVFEWNSRRGIGSVMPRRKGDKKTAIDHPDWDDDGVPHCTHCGGDTDFVAWIIRPGNTPLLRFKCCLPETADCVGIQSISPARGWSQLLPIWRTSEIYGELLVTHETFERVHHQLRARFNVGPDAHGIRPKRIGLGCQQLRATTALLVMWLNVPLMLGLNGAPALLKSVDRVRRDERRVKREQRLATARRDRGRIGGAFPSRRE